MNRRRRYRSQAGFSLLEVLVAMSMIAIIGLALTSSVMLSFRYQKYTEIGITAKNLAVSKAEELSGVALDDLDDEWDEAEENLHVTGHRFTFNRNTNITVNADGSRTVDVTVTSNSPFLPTPISYSTRFAPWES